MDVQAFGKTERGVWVMKGREGELEVEEYDDKGVLESTEEHGRDDAGPLAAAGLQNKRKALNSMLQEASAERSAKAVKAPAAPVDMNSILSMLQSAGHVSKGGAEGTKPTEGQADGSDAQETESSECEEDNPMQRLQHTIKGKNAALPKKAAAPKKAPQAKACSSPAAASAAPASARVFCGAANPSKTNAPAAGETAPAAAKTMNEESPKDTAHSSAPDTQTFSLDGRGQRLQESLEKHIREVEKTLGCKINFEEDFEDTKEAKKANQPRTKLLNSLLTSVKAQLRRVDESANKAGLQNKEKMLQALQEELKSLLTLSQLLQTSNPDVEELNRAFEKSEQLLESSAFGLSMRRRIFDANASSLCVYRNWSGLASLYNEDDWRVPELTRRHIVFSFLLGWTYRI